MALRPRGLVLICLLAFAHLARATSREIQCLHEAFASLIAENKLLNQGDAKLHKMGLIVEGGGLCGPTCMTNLKQAIGRKLGKSDLWVGDHHANVSKTIKALSRGEDDARLGIDPSNLTDELSRSLNGPVLAHAPEAPFTFRTKIIGDVVGEKTEGTVASITEHDLGSANRSSIISFGIYDDGKYNGRHFMILSKYEPSTGAAEFVDPNFPNQITQATLKPASVHNARGGRTFEVKFENSRYDGAHAKNTRYFLDSVVSIGMPEGNWKSLAWNALKGNERALEGQRIRIHEPGIFDWGTHEVDVASVRPNGRGDVVISGKTPEGQPIERTLGKGKLAVPANFNPLPPPPVQWRPVGVGSYYSAMGREVRFRVNFGAPKWAHSILTGVDYEKQTFTFRLTNSSEIYSLSMDEVTEMQTVAH